MQRAGTRCMARARSRALKRAPCGGSPPLVAARVRGFGAALVVASPHLGAAFVGGDEGNARAAGFLPLPSPAVGAVFKEVCRTLLTKGLRRGMLYMV